MSRTKEHKAKVKADWYRRTKEKRLQVCKNYRLNNSNLIKQRRLDKYWDDPEASRARSKKYRCPMKRRKVHLRKMYGITEEEFFLMIDKQNNNCAICKLSLSNVTNNNICIDHCHCCGLVRGIVHRKCNTIIGQADDDIEVLSEAIKYLIQHNKNCIDDTNISLLEISKLVMNK